MDKIVVGKVGGKDLALPREIQTCASAALGLRGSGKSTTAAVIVEELLRLKAQVVIIDPTDVWWGLKSSQDGLTPGYPIVIAGGEHGDVPLDDGDGATLADFIVETGASIVLSLRHLRKAGQKRFMVDLAEQLYHRKGKPEFRTPCLLVIDECDTFIPQRVMGDVARLVGAIEDLVRRGRSAGIGVMLISQRAASINKDVLTQIELLVAHRHVGPQDRKALEEWIAAHDTADRRAEFMGALASLPVGTAWFWSPGWLDLFERVEVRPRRTFDSSATPKAGAAPATPQAMAEIDLEALTARLGATIERARAEDPRELKAQVSILKTRIAELELLNGVNRRAVEALKANAETASKNVLESNLRTWRRQAEYALERFDEKLKEHFEALRTDARAPLAVLIDAFEKNTDETEKIDPSPEGLELIARLGTGSPHERAREDLRAGEPKIGRCERMILAVLKRYDQGRSRVQLAVITGYAAKGGGFSNALGRLKAMGMIVGNNTCWKRTVRGNAYAGDVPALPTGRRLLEYWQGQLGRCEREILSVLAGRREGMNKEDLARQTPSRYEPHGGGFSNALGKLRTLELIERSGGEIRLNDLLR